MLDKAVEDWMEAHPEDATQERTTEATTDDWSILCQDQTMLRRATCFTLANTGAKA